MKIFRDFKSINGIEPAVVAMGNFDGIHKGHRKLIETAVEEARLKGIKAAVFTFTDHPMNVMTGTVKVKTILGFEEKVEILENIGVDYLFSLDFQSVRTMLPHDFVTELLIGKCRMKEAICGFNFSYGFKAQGDVSSLKQEADTLGFVLKIIEPVIINGVVVSSTIIRACLEKGDVDEYQLYTGRPYTLEGKVMEGEKNGRKMGFPTVNLNLSTGMALPANGVYVTKIKVEGQCYNSITNVGRKPTIGEFEKNAETHIFDFQKDVYGKPVKVTFIKMLREERTFSSLDELAKQIDSDCIAARRYHDEIH